MLARTKSHCARVCSSRSTLAHLANAPPELSAPSGGTPHVSFAELIAVLLTGLAISLAILGVIIAGLAIWGYRAIREESKAIAIKTVRIEAWKQIIRYLSSEEGAKTVETEVTKRFDELKEGFDLAQSYSQSESKGSIISGEDQKARVGKPYRKERGANDANPST
jgi:type IV secretory pathway VirB2 component (pilin)